MSMPELADINFLISRALVTRGILRRRLASRGDSFILVFHEVPTQALDSHGLPRTSAIEKPTGCFGGSPGAPERISGAHPFADSACPPGCRAIKNSASRIVAILPTTVTMTNVCNVHSASAAIM